MHLKELKQHDKVHPEECEYTPKESSHKMQEGNLNPKELKQHGTEKVIEIKEEQGGENKAFAIGEELGAELGAEKAIGIEEALGGEAFRCLESYVGDAAAWKTSCVREPWRLT